MRPDAQFIAGSAQMTELLRQLRMVAPLDTSVLIQGESGTGKELAARFLHRHHPRRSTGPLVSVHCGAIPATLLESELFGHVRGAFTGADRDRVGRFEQAHGGTLFLDEIATMTGEAQVRLLRVLQERKVTRLGSTESREVDVRVITASNQSLKTLVERGSFRSDLFYRVNTFPVEIPPLRERIADIAALVELFSVRVAEKLGLEARLSFSDEALHALAAHEWPGNVRELENAVEYACIQGAEHGTVRPEHLPSEISGARPNGGQAAPGVLVPEQGLSFRTAVTSLERELILQSLRLADGNKARAAELLDLKRTTFLEKLRRLEQEGLLTEPQPERSSDEGSTGLVA